MPVTKLNYLSAFAAVACMSLPSAYSLAASPAAQHAAQRFAPAQTVLPQIAREELAHFLRGDRSAPVRGGVCGNAIADAGEQCDDGNAVSGDGCSATCEVEDGFFCTEPLPPVFNNVADGGFENGLSTGAWTQTGTVFAPLCSGLTCLGDAAASLAFAGDWWAWFGGSSSPNAQTLTQSLFMPADAPTLTFELLVSVCDSADDTLSVTIDGNEVNSRSCDATTAGYQTQSIDLSSAQGGPYNDDAAHTLVFAGSTLASNGSNSNFYLDQVQIHSPAPPVPSLCEALPCGDAVLDTGEQCDDGNVQDGDGCNMFCQIEAGYSCTLPVPAVTSGNVIGDGGFELPGANAGTVNPYWAETGTVFTPLCNSASCSVFLGNEGEGFAWFGGTDTPNSQSLQQTITIPADVTSVNFGLLIAGPDGCDGPDDHLRISIDGNVVFRTADPCVTSGGGIGNYPINTLDLAAGGYNDNGSHVLRIEADTFAANGANTNFLLDSMSGPFALDPPIPPVPSACALQPQTCYLEDFDDAGSGDLAGWTLLNNGSLAADWGTTDDGVCGSNNVGPGNFSGGTGEAACIDSDAVNLAAVNAYLCSPQIALTGSGSTLDFLYSYHPFLAPGADDAFEVLVGTETPSLASVAGYASVFFTNAAQGALIALPGASESLDLTAFEGSAVYVCFRYGGDFDWYAHVDDVAVRAQSCNADADGDGVPDDVDNCTNDANPLQIDSNGDGIGNVCDGDIAGPGGPGADDCTVNFLDLGQMRNVFFSGDPDADLVGAGNSEPDGTVNFIDLGRMKELFFAAPGPSASGCN